MEEISAAIGKIVMAIIAGILLTIFRGYLISKFWLWFIVSTFNVQTIRIVEAIGISFILSFVMDNAFKTTTLDKEKGIMRFLITALVYCILWGLAWILYQFM